MQKRRSSMRPTSDGYTAALSYEDPPPDVQTERDVLVAEIVADPAHTYKAMRSSRRASKRHVPVVYYMRMGDLVKIGTTISIGTRTSQLGVQGVMALEPGGSAVEHERHGQFSHLHDHLEWFRLAPDLVEHINERREVFEREMGVTTEVWLQDWLPRPKAKSRTMRDVVAI